MCFVSAICLAQTGINYKAILNDNSGSPIVSTLVAVQFAIYEGSATGTLVYQEDHVTTTSANGMVILNIGGGNASTGTYDTINWGGNVHYLNVQVNSGGGLVDLGTTQFLAVPYALNIPTESLGIDDLSDGIASTTSVALGTDAGLNDISTAGNTFVGANAGKNNTTGESNTYLGRDSGANTNTGTGSNNVALGAYSGSDLSTGSDNVIVGTNAGASITTGSGNIIIGSSAGGTLNYSNRMYIDNSNTSTPLVYGDFTDDRLLVNRTNPISDQERFGIRANTPAAGQYGGMYVETSGASNSRPFYGFGINNVGKAWFEFDGTSQDIIAYNSNGDFRVQFGTGTKPVAGSWAANSDKRLKKNIVPLNQDDMLQRILQMQGVSYDWNDTVTEIKRPAGTQIGFIAQDLRKIWPEKVSEDHLGYLQTAYGDYDPVIIEAIKALHEKIENQEREINTLKRKVSALDAAKRPLASQAANKK